MEDDHTTANRQLTWSGFNACCDAAEVPAAVQRAAAFGELVAGGRALPFDGFALGGSLGKDRDDMLQMLGQLMPALPREKPNHLLGIADEASVRGAVALGVDTFDSCLPTR